MAVNITDADAYIDASVIVCEDWDDSDESRKTRLLNKASNVLANKYVGYTIPDSAAYEYASFLATVFNDTNKYAQQGALGFAVSGVVSFSFKGTQVKPFNDIPKAVVQLINDDESNADLPSLSSGRGVKWTVL
jgi:hypothetical protein